MNRLFVSSALVLMLSLITSGHTEQSYFILCGTIYLCSLLFQYTYVHKKLRSVNRIEREDVLLRMKKGGENLLLFATFGLLLEHRSLNIENMSLISFLYILGAVLFTTAIEARREFVRYGALG